MAIRGEITHKGIEVNVPYIKVSITGISENITTVDQKEVKKFILQFGYGMFKEKGSEQFGSGHESMECDIEGNLFTQAYEHLANKFNISKTEI